MMTLGGSFFDSICQVSFERMHSALIGWIFSTDCTALSAEDKVSVLQSLLGSDFDFEHLSAVRVFNEFEHIDILIEGDNFVIAVETKLKSTEHNDQLKSYSKCLNEEFPKKKIFKVYLSLLEEKHSEWNCILFDDLYDRLSEHVCIENIDGVILTEYYKSLEHLIQEKNNFLSDHRLPQYLVVFENGSKTKAQKRMLTDYVSVNQFETIFQRLFCRELIKMKFDTPQDWIISETHGVADIYKEIEQFNKKCNFNFAFQGGTFKIALTKNGYHKSKAIDIPNNWITVFETYAKDKGWRCQKPKSRGRIALTKKWNKQFYELSKDDIADKIEKEYQSALGMVDTLKERIANL